MKKYNIEDLVKNTDFEAQRRDTEIKDWGNKTIIGRENPEYFNFSIEQLEKAMSEKSETMPKIETIEELDAWLERGEDNG